MRISCQAPWALGRPSPHHECGVGGTLLVVTGRMVWRVNRRAHPQPLRTVSRVCPSLGRVSHSCNKLSCDELKSDAAGADRRGDHRAGKVREADGGDLVEVWTDGGRAHATPLTITRSQKSTSGWKARPAEATLLPVPVGNLILSRNIRPCGKGTIASSTQRGRSNTATVKGSHAVEHALERPLRRDFGLCL